MNTWPECTEPHDFQPVNNMQAVYRCTACGLFAFKAKARTGIGTNEFLTPYKCRSKDCQERVVVIYPKDRRGFKKFRPSCQLHRPDKQNSGSEA